MDDENITAEELSGHIGLGLSYIEGLILEDKKDVAQAIIETIDYKEHMLSLSLLNVTLLTRLAREKQMPLNEVINEVRDSLNNGLG